jgi:hypothetical protein
MLYVHRDKDGTITSISKTKSELHQEELVENHPDVLHFLNVGILMDEKERQFIKSDLQMIRVLDDLIDLLIRKHVITFTDLPVVAQEKILKRQNLRDKLAGLISEDDNVLGL